MQSKWYTASVWIMRIFFLNIIWVIAIFPLIYVSLGIAVRDFSELKMIIILLAVLAPFFFYPATTAVYGVVRKWLMGETDIPLLGSFWKYYRENYLRSWQGGIIFSLLALGISYNLVFTEPGSVLKIVYWVLAGFLLAWNIMYFCFIVHFENKWLQTVKNTFILTGVGFPNSIGYLIIHGGLIYLTLKWPVIFILCIGALSAYCSYFLFNQLVISIPAFHPQEEESEVEEIDQNQEYFETEYLDGLVDPPTIEHSTEQSANSNQSDSKQEQ